MSHQSIGRQHAQDRYARGPVFSDPTGRRWRRIRRFGIAVLVLALAGFAAVYPVLFTPLHISARENVSRPHLTKQDTSLTAPILGSGPLERVVKISHGGAARAVDPYTGEQLGALSVAEAVKVRDAPYAVQRYGYSPELRKTLSLTFDDGPNAKITPQLLDLLSREHVPATFFVTGPNAMISGDIVRRMVREGHAVGDHTVSHPHLAEKPEWRTTLETGTAEHVIRHVSGHGTRLVRIPYTSPEDGAPAEEIENLLRLQRLGYVHCSYDFDSYDWLHDAQPNGRVEDIPMPDLGSGENFTVLMHDAGGPNRERTLQYVARLIAKAKAEGYSFQTMAQANPTLRGAVAPVAVTWQDRVAAGLVWLNMLSPNAVMNFLFWVAVVLMVGFGGVNALLAVLRSLRRRRMVWPDIPDRLLPVSVVLAAYNEEPVIERTVRTVMASKYPLAEVVVVDDGSTDGTAAVVRKLTAEFPGLVLVCQANGGKSAALNHGLERARGEVVVTLDADTIVTPDTVGNLVRHFLVDADGGLGAVAGVVRVGNRQRNLLTRWQALEYLTQIGLDRSAQDQIGGVSIIPGACAAWRREAIVAAGGYSPDTLAEDCDLALTLHEAGWRVSQDDAALAFTEAPESLDDLLKQRTRWAYGTLQAMWKHRGLIFNPRHPGLGFYTLPNYVLSIVIPLIFLPFTTWMAIQTLQAQGPGLLIRFFIAFAVVHALLVGLALLLMRESWRHLLVVPIYRLFYEPLRAYLLYSSILCALQGRGLGWNKLVRTGGMDEHHLSTVLTPREVTA